MPSAAARFQIDDSADSTYTPVFVIKDSHPMPSAGRRALLGERRLAS